MIRRTLCLLSALALVSGCDWTPPGKPKLYEKWQSPSLNRNFTSLYSQNCLACHGASPNIAPGLPKALGPSLPMDNPVYLALVPEATVQSVIANGIHGTSMPAFAQSQGGELNDDQVKILTAAILSSKRPMAPNQPALPPYSAPLGDATRGAQVYSTYCASCHGADGKGGPNGGSVVNAAYLGLVSDQYLRTITIVGRPDLGMPDWKTYVPGKVMSNQDIADVVAWLASHRLKPGASVKPVSATPSTTTAP